MAVPVDGHADAMRERRERDHDLGVRLAHPVVGHHRRLDTVLRELPEKLERDVRDDLDVHPRVVVDLEARDRVHIRDVPPGLHLVVAVDAADHPAERLVPPDGHVDPHPRDRLDGGEANLALCLGRDRIGELFRFELVLFVHGRELTPEGRKCNRPRDLS